LKDTFQLVDPGSPRMDIAVAALLDGPGFAYEGVWIHIVEGDLCCDALSTPTYQRETDSALALMRRAQSVLSYLDDSSVELAAIVSEHEPRFFLVDDYSNGWVRLAELVDGEVQWAGSHTTTGAD
jgi:hypothetical protein